MYQSTDGYSNSADPLAGSGFEFDDKMIRLGFIRKVYGILMCQLLVTIGFISLFLYCEPVRVYTRQNTYLFWLAFAITLVAILVLACCQDIRRKTPHNYIFLGVFTVAEGFMLGTAAGHYSADTVLIAVGVCAVVCFALTCFAFQTKFDFTAFGGILFVLLIVLFCFGLLAMIIPGKTIQLVYACLGALLFCAYLVFDTQMMMGGKHSYSISPEEYVFAALNLYLDVVNLFLFILQIVGAARGD